MIARIEPTGTSIRKGKVQIRFSFYLEPGDARYEEHHVDVLDADGNPTGEKRDNPFHNHFVWISPDATDAEIAKLLRDSLAEFYGMWSRGEDIVRTWKRRGREMPGDMSPENIERCELKGLDIANRAVAFEHRGRR